VTGQSFAPAGPARCSGKKRTLRYGNWRCKAGKIYGGGIILPVFSVFPAEEEPCHHHIFPVLYDGYVFCYIIRKGYFMCMIFNFEDLVANALIESIEDGKEPQVTYSQLEKYGKNVLETLSKQGKSAVIPASRINIENFIHNYSDYFELEEAGSDYCIKLKDDKNVTDLRKYFRAYLPLELLHIFSGTKLLESPALQ
jgi:hypothetical protein